MSIRTIIHGVSYLLVAIGSLSAINYQKNRVLEERNQSIPSFKSEYEKNGVPVLVLEAKSERVVLRRKISILIDKNKRLKAFVDKDTLRKVKVGGEVVLYNKEQSYQTKVLSFSRNIDLNTGLYKVLIEPVKNMNLDNSWYEGDLVFRKKTQDIVIPLESVVKSKNGREMVWIAKDGLAQTQEIKISYSDGYQAVVSSGIKPGDLVIQSKTELLKEKLRVLVVKSEGSKS